jgi:hypothetical protein
MKKVLVISYYWPPAGGISVHRSLKIVKYLRSFGWEPTVLAPLDAHYSYYDDGNLKDIPENLTVIRKRIIEPFATFKLISGRKKNESMNNILHVRSRKQTIIDKLGIWIRANFFIPDARALWIGPSVRYLRRYLKKNPVDVLFADGPPHTNNVIAMKVSKKTGIPYLADFQDPWTQVDYYELFPFTRWADKKHRKLEQAVFRQASRITIASPSWKKELEKIGARNVEVLYWGYDDDDYVNLVPEKDPSFSITHMGLMGFDRNPQTLFRILNELIDEIPGFKSDLKLKLIGQTDYSIKKSIKNFNLEDVTINYGIINRSRALNISSGSSLLLLLLNQAKNAKGRLPGKLYEYLKIRRPILALGIKDSDAERIIKETGAGVFFEYTDYKKLKEYLILTYKKYKEDNLPDTTGNIEKYSVKNQVRKLASFFNDISKE